MDDAPADFTARLVQAIVGIEIKTNTLTGKLKASQNQPERNRVGVKAGLGAGEGEHNRAMSKFMLTKGCVGRLLQYRRRHRCSAKFQVWLLRAVGMKKISIIGSGGSGKSTLAKKLEQKTGIPAYHLDALFWQPGWVETERGKWRFIQEDLCNKDAWILDGNYGSTLDIRLRYSDTIIFLDINRFTCLVRAILRSVKSYGRTRPDMAEGCKEHFDISFAKWILEYPTKRKPGILERLNALPPEKSVIILSSPKEVEEFLRNA